MGKHISMRAGLIVASISESRFASQGIGRLSGALLDTEVKYGRDL